MKPDRNDCNPGGRRLGRDSTESQWKRRHTAENIVTLGRFSMEGGKRENHSRKYCYLRVGGQKTGKYPREIISIKFAVHFSTTYFTPVSAVCAIHSTRKIFSFSSLYTSHRQGQGASIRLLNAISTKSWATSCQQVGRARKLYSHLYYHPNETKRSCHPGAGWQYKNREGYGFVAFVNGIICGDGFC